MSLNRLDLNLLHALDALLMERNVTRAARRLFVSQQAMSGTLRRLRDHFEDDLLTRVGRDLELTSLGSSLIAPAREALLAANFVFEGRQAFDPAMARRDCRVALSDFASFVLLPNLMRRLCATAPGISCTILPLSGDAFGQLERGELDFCLSPNDERSRQVYHPGQDIRSAPMFSDDFVCIFDENNPLAASDLTLEAYCSALHNSVRFDGDSISLVERAWSDAKLRLRIVATAPTFAGLIFMLPGTPLVATTQRKLAEAIAPGLNLRILECPLPIAPLHEALSWHRRSERDPGHAYLRDLLFDISADMAKRQGRHPCGAQP